MCAGAIVQGLRDRGYDLTQLAGNDETIAALALYQTWATDLQGLLKAASHGQRLLGLGNHADLAFCAQLDTLDVLPIQKAPGVLGV